MHSLPPQQSQLANQRPLPQVGSNAEWFNPPAPLMSAYNFGNSNTGFWTGPGGGTPNSGTVGAGGQYGGMGIERHGSLSQEQQFELMDVLENEGMSDINTYLNLGMDFSMGNTGMNWAAGGA